MGCWGAEEEDEEGGVGDECFSQVIYMHLGIRRFFFFECSRVLYDVGVGVVVVVWFPHIPSV